MHPESKTKKMKNMDFKNWHRKICQAKCPTCGGQIPFSIVSKYFWHGTSYYVSCTHCGQRIHPEKEPVNTFACMCLGGISIMAPMNLYWYIVAWDFIPALLFALPFVIITIIVVCILILHNIKFSI